MDTDWLKNLARLYMPVYRYESDTLKIAYAGYSSIKRNYYVRFILGKSSQHTFLGRKVYWQITDLIKSSDFDIIISEVSQVVLNHFHKSNGFIIPGWVMMRINIDRPLSEICNKHESHFSDVKRRIRKHNLTYEIIAGADNITYFYEKFYLPYMSRRHGEEAWIEELDIIKELSSSPFFLAVREEGVIAGISLLKKAEGSLYLLRMGLLDGNEEYRSHGVIGALYYFAMLEAQNMGCRVLELGGTRPFLSDGLTKFKSGLGAEFTTNNPDGNEYLWLGINGKSTAAKEFMRRNPVMHFNKDFVLTSSES
jgi:hypothetical protein